MIAAPFVVIIPARYASTRLPGKVILDIAGKPMIQHVYERACQSGAEEVIIATDSELIKEIVNDFGGRVCMTAVTHRSGTERISEVIEHLNIDPERIIVNVQGDEPLINPAHIHQVAHNLSANKDAHVATLCEVILEEEKIFNPNIVKVVFDSRSFALYFSRAPIAWINRETKIELPEFASAKKDLSQNELNHFRHVGIYAYCAAFVKKYMALPVTRLEQMESLEQLRVLWHGYKIHVEKTAAVSFPGIDTEHDLRVIRQYFTEGR